MSIVIELESQAEKALRRKAISKGFKVDTYVKDLIEREIGSELSYEEILTPVREDFEKSKMTEEEFDEFVDDLREKVWQEKNGEL